MTAVIDCSGTTHGTLLEVEPLEGSLWPEGAEQAYRIDYAAPNYSGEMRAVSGSVFVPKRTEATAPVLTWAHCTVGINEHNAPSRVGLIRAEKNHVAQWLQAGFVVAATDYEGIGTPEPHPYLDGEAIADDIIDIALAVHAMDLAVDQRTVIGGFSQGGHGSLFAAALCTAYAPHLDLRGTVALAPPVRFLDFVQAATANGQQPVHALLPTILAGLQTRRPEFAPDVRLAPKGRELVAAAKSSSMRQLNALCRETTYDESGITGIAAWQPLIEVLESTSPPATSYDRPIFLCTGGADPVLSTARGRDFATALSDRGTRVTFHDFETFDHLALLEPAARTATRWAADLVSTDGAGPRTDDPRVLEKAHRFRVLDATRNGRIELDDFRAHALRLIQSFGRPLGHPVAVQVRDGYERLARDLIRYYDQDGDGSIDLHEFLAVGAERDTDRLTAGAATLVHAIMGLLDTPESTLTRAQFRSVAQGLGIGPEEADDIFDHTDTDGNGRIDEEELTAGVVEFLVGENHLSPGYWLFGRLH
ncbi:lipase family protein [Nocardia huaxiensis]|uniref:lipase family protein n=1 Tax=Nocardia huaxiensis TaxID=2755382 RepID=UPI001E56EBED|nr:lipase family protein [Nocardia huaxiensis]UFS99130.1 EF-hand domain-containing protein [Nocardia huaxiensis]